MKITKTLEKASNHYIEHSILRASIQIIPYVGGALDTLFSDKGLKIQHQRIETFLSELDNRLKKIEGLVNLEPTEELYDLFISILDGVVKTRSTAKHKYFASVVSNQVSVAQNWEEAETAARILKELEEIHIQILIFSMSTPFCSYPFDNLQVVTLEKLQHDDKNQQQPASILEAFPGYSEDVLRMNCSELLSKSLLYDEGIGRMSTKSMQYFVATDLAKWFINWIKT